MTKIGFIGLGVMGNSMVKHLLEDKHELFVYNRTKSKADEAVSLRAKWCQNPAEVAKQSDVVMTILGYPTDVEQVYFQKDGLFENSKAGQIFIDLTTSSPTLAQKISEQGEKQGVATFDAPVSGGDIGAREGRLTTMVGGSSKETFDKIEALLQSFSAKVTYLGKAGNGQHTKMANQIMIAGTMTGMVETLIYAENVGLNAETVIDILGSGAASNWSLANYGPRILKEDYSAGFFVKHFLKDLGIALEEAKKLDLDLPGTKLAAKLYQQLVDEGYGDLGTQALMKLWQ